MIYPVILVLFSALVYSTGEHAIAIGLVAIALGFIFGYQQRKSEKV